MGEVGVCDTSCPLRGLPGPSFHGLSTLLTWIHGFFCPPGGDVQYSTVVLGGFIGAQPSWASLVALVVKNLPANTEAARFNPWFRKIP